MHIGLLPVHMLATSLKLFPSPPAIDYWRREGTGLISRVSSFHTAAPHKAFLAANQAILPAALRASLLFSPCPHHHPTHCDLCRSPSDIAYTCNRYSAEEGYVFTAEVSYFLFGVTARGSKRPRSRSWDPSSFPPGKTGPGRPLTQLGRPRTRTAAAAALSQPRKDREEFRKALVGLVM